MNLTVFLLQENRAVHGDVTLFVLFSGEEKQHFLKIIIAFFYLINHRAAVLIIIKFDKS